MRKFNLFITIVSLFFLVVSCTKDNDTTIDSRDDLIEKQFVYNGITYTVKCVLDEEGELVMQDDSEAAKILEQLSENENLAEFVDEDGLSMFFDNQEQLKNFLVNRRNLQRHSEGSHWSGEHVINIIVKLYEHNDYKGEYRELSISSNYDYFFYLDVFRYREFSNAFNDKASSIKIINNSFYPKLNGWYVAFYEHSDLKGRSLVFEVNEGVNIPSLKNIKLGGWALNRRDWNDHISSFQIVKNLYDI